MSSVAIAAGTSDVAGHRSEADVVRSAAKADREAFDELYRRHHQITWRLAQALSAPEPASEAVADGFGQALRAVRRQRSLADQPFRPRLLAATYQAGMGTEPTADASGDAGAPTAVMAAFRSLPDRWRAALWLADVEHLGEASVAAVLGVSAPVALQLADRGRQGLLTRFAQVGVAAPEHLDAVLRPLAGSPPASLEALVAKRWRSAITVDPGGRLVPASEWLAGRATKPLMTVCGGLVALGIVGLGVLTVASPPATRGPAAAISAPGFNGPQGTNPSSGSGVLFGPGNGTSTFLGSLTTGSEVNPILAGEGSTGSLTGTAGTISSPVSATGTSATGTTSSGSTSGGATGTSGGGSNAGSGGSSGSKAPVTTPPTTTPKSTPVVDVPNVATVNTGTGGTTATVGSTTDPVVGVAATPTCTGLEVLNIATNTCVLKATSSTTTPVSSLGSTLTTTVGGIVGGL